MSNSEFHTPGIEISMGSRDFQSRILISLGFAISMGFAISNRGY